MPLTRHTGGGDPAESGRPGIDIKIEVINWLLELDSGGRVHIRSETGIRRSKPRIALFYMDLGNHLAAAWKRFKFAGISIVAYLDER